MNDEKWSKDIAILIADSLADGALIDRANLSRATDIIAEEIWIRLLGKDFPPGATNPDKRIVVQPGHAPRSAG